MRYILRNILLVTELLFLNSLVYALETVPQSENKGAEVIPETESPRPYPRVHFSASLIGDQYPNLISFSNELLVLDGLSRFSFARSGYALNAHWFLTRNMGLSIEYSNLESDLNLFDFDFNLLTYRFFKQQNVYAGLQFRLLAGNGIVFSEFFPESEKKKPINQNCCSFFGEVKAGLSYLDYSGEYLNSPIHQRVDILPLGPEGNSALALGLKFRFGFILYFPIFYTELSLGGTSHLFFDDSNSSGFKSLECIFSAGIYY